MICILITAGYTTLPARPDINYNRVSLNISGGGGSVGDLTIQWNVSILMHKRLHSFQRGWPWS
jgi:hypothetical protein